MIEFLRCRNRLQVMVIAVIAAILTVTIYCTYLHQGFISPISVVSMSPVYVPFVFNKHYVGPDRELGIAEHTPEEAAMLGLPDADYISGQWRLPLDGDTTVFFTITERDHWSTWLLCSWSPHSGWYDEDGCRQHIRNNPGTICIIGNELKLDSPIGIGDLIDTDHYAQWYHDAWELIKSEDSTALVGPYGPCQNEGGILVSVWNAYQEMYGELMPVDFYPVHFYCQVEDEPWWCWTQITHWIDWLEQHRGTRWAGPQDYWLTEWGLMAWQVPVSQEVALALMEGVIPELRDNTIGITRHAWWPSCNSGWPSDCTLLIQDGYVTELGEKYLELALD